MRSRLLLAAVTLLGIAGCAPVNPPKVAVQPTPAAAGIILSMRPVSESATEEPLRATLLATGGGQEASDRSLVEFIVRVDDGATLSIVQPNDAGFQKGDRVIILRDGRTHLARPG